MNYYPLQAQSFSFLIKSAFKAYLPVFKQIFPLIALWVLVRELYLYFDGLIVGHALRLFVIFITLLIEVYLWAVVLWRTHTVLAGTRESLNESCGIIYRKLPSILMGFFALLLLLCALFGVGYYLSYWFAKVFSNQVLAHNLLILFLVGIPSVFFFVVFFFVVPLLVLKSMGLKQAFQQSFRLVWYKNGLKTFFIYAVFIILNFIISLHTMHGQWLLKHHLHVIFDLVVLTLVSPILFSLILLLLNDFELRRSQRL